MNKKKIIIGSIIIVSICLLIGTLAWLTWRSRETGLVLTVGDINNLQVTLKPYQIDTEIIPVLTYDNEEYVTVNAVNNSSRTKKVRLYYRIDAIDTELIDENFKYTITKSIDGNTYEEYLTGNFSEASSNSNLYIMEENIPKNTTYNYKVYLWLDGSSSGQGSISGKIFKGELRVEFDSVNDIIVDTSDGLIPITYDTSDNNTLVKTISKDDENWYNYDEKKWANGVLVTNGLTETSAYDLSGNNTENTINGATITEEGLNFDGVDDYVLLPQYNISTMTDGFTFEANFKVNSIADMQILTNLNTGGGGIYLAASGYLHTYVYANGAYVHDLGVKVAIGKVYHVVGAFDGVNVKLYVDGKLIQSTEVNGNIVDASNTTHYVLGCNPTNTVCQGQYFDGTIYQARMYDRALSDSEVLDNYNGNITDSNLLFNFDFVDGKKKLYKGTSGVTIPEEDILAYYVYVPRYKYKIWEAELSSAGKEQEIDISFENKTMSKSNGNKVDEYLTHPAFTFGNDELNGIWVGKFETGGTKDNPSIKPNILSLRNQTVAQAFITNQIFGTNNYGVTTNTNSHMAKNSEWGAAAYLTNSKYGRCTNGVCEEINRNNNSDHYTGYSAVHEATTGYSETSSSTNEFGTGSDITRPYNTEIGYKASTTGNIYGIYDMSGGAWERVMGVLSDPSGNPRSGNTSTTNSGYNGMLGDGSMYTLGIDLPYRKYYDLYISTSTSSIGASLTLNACDGEVCYGHGLSETANWYKDYAEFVFITSPWLGRGGHFDRGYGAGLLNFGYANGGINVHSSSRAVLCVLD